MYPETIDAIGITDVKQWTKPSRFSYTPQEFRDYDVDIEIEACGICGSDIHTVKCNWGDIYTPMAVGHEIVGKVVKIGPKAKAGLKLGDRVGVGAQCDACGTCARCCKHYENNCLNAVDTYYSAYPSGIKTQGGDASHIRVNSKFAFKIPDNISSEHAAPLMCGGITGVSPLFQNNVGKGSKVGVQGIGGIGHMTVLYAKAMGAEVTAISRSRSKEADSKKLAVDHYIATAEKGWEEKYKDTLDLIVITASSFSEGEFDKVLTLLTARGKIVFITAPPITESLKITPFSMLRSGYSVGGSVIGSPDDIDFLLEFTSKNNIKPWVETFDISEEGLGKAWEYVDSGKPRYRVTMVGYDKAFKK
ncbi:GroES-like protein [Lipomyces oligophaga]|uniref:GroES-like protein n=1 Tax=Lipomyces oligophaga TaxID=45792 RepID=UPI0034CE1282